MLDIRGLSVELTGSDRPFHILRNVDLSVKPGEILGIAGESGSGKTMLARTILGLIAPPIEKTAGAITLEGNTLETPADFRAIRGTVASIIFQNPTASLNPVFTIGKQMTETLMLHHRDMTRKQARSRAAELLAEVEITYPEERLNSYPHQLSGGMNQRVMIAMALSSNPRLLIADEPTTALDVTIQQQIIALLASLREKNDLSIIFISHDLSLLEKISDRCIIVYAGETMEALSGDDLENGRVRHPYTKSLKDCIPTLDKKDAKLATIPGTIAVNDDSQSDRCIFAERCFNRIDACTKAKPELTAEKPFRCINPVG